MLKSLMGLTLFLLDHTSLDLFTKQRSFLPNTLLISWTAFEPLLKPPQSTKTRKTHWKNSTSCLTGRL